MNTRILGLAAGLAVLFASTSWAQSITVAIGSEPSTLDPQLRDDGGERQVNDNIYEALMARTATGDLVPGLAADAPTQVDARTWQFKLREGIKFHNGEPFNADAVVASVLRVIDPANNSEQMAYLGPLSGAEKVDDLTVRIITSAPRPDPAGPDVLAEDGPCRLLEERDRHRGEAGRNRPLQVRHLGPREQYHNDGQHRLLGWGAADR